MVDIRPETRVLSGAELKTLYKTLNNPLRRAILDYLGQHGEANSTSVAKALGESTGTTSYHLRKLAEFKLIAEIPERSTGRERWWRGLPKSLYTPPGLEMTDEERVAAMKLGAMKLSHDSGLLIRAYTEYDSSDNWIKISRGGTVMTKEEVQQFYAEYETLLWKYTHGPGDRPVGARQLAIRLVVLPDEDEFSPTLPDRKPEE
ncbi:MAG: ArsR family transcriptional regulator [Amycolatopsis sp.]|jgi:DNA-binding transcriptional ArsR family regulator|uniref:ArsR/SmtB family transcription factor n=1 Tax=Amycolatopsis sp. TaxID=37632 RepID=UPI00260D0254|nr:helix-turn-helix domain-containing protein [Amycolatopsis sp.]MCU1679869.1 ArsR family transcriptional regulator [Amycolatopsis sp.]